MKDVIESRKGSHAGHVYLVIDPKTNLIGITTNKRLASSMREVAAALHELSTQIKTSNLETQEFKERFSDFSRIYKESSSSHRVRNFFLSFFSNINETLKETSEYLQKTKENLNLESEKREEIKLSEEIQKSPIAPPLLSEKARSIKQAVESIQSLYSRLQSHPKSQLIHENLAAHTWEEIYEELQKIFATSNIENVWDKPTHGSYCDAYLAATHAYFLKLEDFIKRENSETLLANGGDINKFLSTKEGREKPQQLHALLQEPFWFYRPLQACNLLHIAGMRNQKEAIIPLLQHGIDPNERDVMGNTPLHWAIANASAQTAIALLDSGQCNCNLKDWGYNRQTPLQFAISKGPRASRWSELVNKLIQQTLDINAQDKNGNTALHLACARREPALIKALLEKGANLNMKNQAGQTPKELWELSYDKALSLLGGSVDTTTLDREARDKALRDILRNL